MPSKIELHLSLEEVLMLRDLLVAWTKKWEDSPLSEKGWKIELFQSGEMEVWCERHGLPSSEDVVRERFSLVRTERLEDALKYLDEFLEAKYGVPLSQEASDLLYAVRGVLVTEVGE